MFSTAVPATVRSDSDLDKERIILDNKNKAGVYQFINLLTEESYVGSSTNLSVRFRQYYNYNYISSPARGKSVIYLSILRNGYSNFSLTILEYCEIKDCINREQFYIDLIKPSMNILQMAGSSLGFKHSEETKALISLANSGINHSLYGKKHLAETLAKMSLAISHANGTAIYVYSSDGKTLINNFPSAIKAGKYFKASPHPIRQMLYFNTPSITIGTSEGHVGRFSEDYI